jgi:hypothetical protein
VQPAGNNPGYCQRDEDNSGLLSRICANLPQTLDAAVYFIFCSNGQGANPGPDRDPSVSIVDIGRTTAKDFNKDIAKGKYSSCEALARFADKMAANSSGTFELVESFDALIPSGSSADNLGLGGDGVLLGTGTGYSQQYQEGYGSATGPVVGANQSHHFAMFFKLGFLSGFGPGAAANLREIIERTSDNRGDINLGLQAAAMGASLRPEGGLKPWDLADTIRENLCTR